MVERGGGREEEQGREGRQKEVRHSQRGKRDGKGERRRDGSQMTHSGVMSLVEQVRQPADAGFDAPRSSLHLSGASNWSELKPISKKPLG